MQNYCPKKNQNSLKFKLQLYHIPERQFLNDKRYCTKDAPFFRACPIISYFTKMIAFFGISPPLGSFLLSFIGILNCGANSLIPGGVVGAFIPFRYIIHRCSPLYVSLPVPLQVPQCSAGWI